MVGHHPDSSLSSKTSSLPVQKLQTWVKNLNSVILTGKLSLPSNYFSKTLQSLSLSSFCSVMWSIVLLQEIIPFRKCYRHGEVGSWGSALSATVYKSDMDLRTKGFPAQHYPVGTWNVLAATMDHFNHSSFVVTQPMRLLNTLKLKKC